MDLPSNAKHNAIVDINW